jgi:formylglycine-generating enzyme required for sulfatase activity
LIAALLAFILLASTLCFGQAPAAGAKPLTREQLMSLVAAGVDSDQLAQTVAARGIGFEPAGADFEQLRKAGAQPALLKVVADLALGQSRGPLRRDLLLQLVIAGVSYEQIIQAVSERGLESPLGAGDFDSLKQSGASEALVRAVREVNPRPLTTDQVLGLVSGGVPSARAATLIKLRGIDFNPTDDYLETLRIAGADDSLLQTVREASRFGGISIQTAPGAEVVLDDQPRGHADTQGALEIRAVVQGAHRLKISLPYHSEYAQSVTVVARGTARVSAPLELVVGEISVETSPGAEVWLDGKSQGRADAGGRLLLRNVPRGEHQLKLALANFPEQTPAISVVAGQAARVTATLELTAGTVKVSSKDGLRYNWIPPGSFTMGCSQGDAECGPDEGPAHRVTISKAFWLGQTEVTVGAYKHFVMETSREMASEPKFGLVALNPGWTHDQMPMVNITWNDADAFCRWSGSRLPTEAQWEYASRAGTTEARYAPLDDVAWYSDNSGQGRLDSARIMKVEAAKFLERLRENANTIHEPGQKRPNAFNLYDILGNVWEWVGDPYEVRYYGVSPELDPPGPESGDSRVLRGGAWNILPRNVRVSARSRNWVSYRNFNVGFRCARDSAP